MTADVMLPGRGRQTDRTGQATQIEQSRAAAEVYYRLAAAKELPRDEADATERMRQACRNYELAKVAFYSVPKGQGQSANGPSVHLARELARIWGNLDYGVVELRRDDEYGQSEMQAFALDLQTNTRPSSLWIQPHKMDTKKGVKHLTEVQAIYESNANAGARRVREAIFAVLPRVFVDEAQAICRATLEKGNGDPIEERRREAVEAFARQFKVDEKQLTAHVGRTPSRWDAQDIADLEVLFGSLKRRERKVDEVFAPAGSSVSLDEARGIPAADEQQSEPLDPDEQEIADQLRREQALADQGGEQ